MDEKTMLPFDECVFSNEVISSIVLKTICILSKEA